jgi:hypothetical protein
VQFDSHPIDGSIPWSGVRTGAGRGDTGLFESQPQAINEFLDSGMLVRSRQKAFALSSGLMDCINRSRARRPIETLTPKVVMFGVLTSILAAVIVRP